MLNTDLFQHQIERELNYSYDRSQKRYYEIRTGKVKKLRKLISFSATAECIYSSHKLGCVRFYLASTLVHLIRTRVIPPIPRDPLFIAR